MSQPPQPEKKPLVDESPKAKTPAAKPKKRRRFRWLRITLSIIGTFLFVFVCLFLVGRWLSLNAAERRLEELCAELDRTDPGWRLAELESARASVPDEENSAHVVRAAMAQFPSTWSFQNVPIELIGPGWEQVFRVEGVNQSVLSMFECLESHETNQRLIPALRQAIETEVKILAKPLHELRKLADVPRSGRYPIQFRQNPLETRLPHLDQIDLLARVLLFSANLQADRGEIESAIAAVHSMINTARSVGDESLLISIIFRFTCIRHALDTLERIIAHGEEPPSDLLKMQGLLRQEWEDQLKLLPRVFRWERAAAHQIGEALANGEMSLDAISSSRAKVTGAEQFRLWTHMREVIRRSQSNALTAMRELVKAGNLPLHEQADALSELEVEDNMRTVRRNQDDFLAVLMFPPVTRIATTHHNLQGRMRATVAALACERFRLQHKRWPEKLTELVPEFLEEVPEDPVVCEPVKLKKTERGIIVYAVGYDREDNDGNIARRGKYEAGQDVGFELFDLDKRRQPPPQVPKVEDMQP